MSTNDPQSPDKPAIDAAKAKTGRRRRTQAEKNAARAAELDKPIDPLIWLILGAILLIIAACIFFDPIGFASAGQSQSDGMWIRDVLVIITGILGKNPTALILAGLAGLSLAWGGRSWLQQRSGAKDSAKPEDNA